MLRLQELRRLIKYQSRAPPPHSWVVWFEPDTLPEPLSLRNMHLERGYSRTVNHGNVVCCGVVADHTLWDAIIELWWVVGSMLVRNGRNFYTNGRCLKCVKVEKKNPCVWTARENMFIHALATDPAATAAASWISFAARWIFRFYSRPDPCSVWSATLWWTRKPASKNAMRRVVVTGLGAVTPLGVGRIVRWKYLTGCISCV